MSDKYISLESDAFFAFNIWSIECAKAVIDGCAYLGRNALLQTSMKAYAACDKIQLREFITSYSRDKGIRAYLHLDHCKDISCIKEAIEYGWDSVMIDGSDLGLNENIPITNEASQIAHDSGVIIEAEIGQITGETGVANYDDVAVFMENTDVDMLAVAIGTSHGLYSGEIKLDYELLKRANETSRIPLVIHGGTGLSDDVLLRLLSFAKVKKINISTDVKQAYRTVVEESYLSGKCKKEGFDPLEITSSIHESIYDMVIKRERLLGKI